MENDEDYKNPSKGDDVELSSRDQEIIFGKDDNSPAKVTLETIEQPQPGAEQTEEFTANDLPQFKDLAKPSDKEKLGQYKTAEKDEPILGLDPSNKDNSAKVPLKTIDQLLIHNSDTAVKPIIGNKDIEKAGELVFNAQILPFEAWTSD